MGTGEERREGGRDRGWLHRQVNRRGGTYAWRKDEDEHREVKEEMVSKRD